MSNSFLFAFTVTAVLTAGAVDFVNQAKVTGGISVQEYLAAIPARLGGKGAEGSSETAAVAEAVPAGSAGQSTGQQTAGQTIDKEALRQKMALAAGQIAAASSAAQPDQPANAEAAAGATSFLSSLLKGMSKASGQPAAAAEEPIKPAEANAAAKPKASLFGNCSGAGLGKRCKVGS